MSTPGKISIFLLLPMILGGAALFAQTQAAVQPQSAGPAGPQAMAPSVYVVAGGVYGTGVYVTPAATLPAQNTGISLSNQAGISLTAPLQTGAATAVPASAESGYSPVPGSTVATGEAGTAPSGRLINDLAPSYYAGSGPETGSATPSLAEIADKYKSAGTHNVRMYTNADAERLAAGVKSGTANSQPAQTQTPPR